MTITVYFFNGEMLRHENCSSYEIRNDGQLLVLFTKTTTGYFNLNQIAGYSIYDEKAKKKW